MKKIISQRGSAAVILLIALAAITAFFAFTQSGAYEEQRQERARTEKTVNDLIARLDIAMQAVEQIRSEQISLGATNKIPDLKALYEDSLASKISSSATSFTLTRGTSSGTALASSTYPFIIDEGTANEEFVLADCTGTACTNVTRGISLTTGTTTVASLQKAHGRGASVKITDGPILLILNRILQGVDTFPNLLAYQSGTACNSSSPGGTICDATFVRNLSGQGAATSSESVGGIAELATQLESASSTDLGADRPLVQQAKYATSTPGYAGLWDVWTNNAGKIAQAFLDLTASFTFSGPVTHSATTTVQGTAANKFIIRALEYIWPSSHTTSGLLTNDGSGTLSWTAVAASSKLFVQTTPVSMTEAATTTIFQTTVPANTLSTANAIRCDVMVSDFDTDHDNAVSRMAFGYGTGTTTATYTKTTTIADIDNARGIFTLMLTGAGTTASQRISFAGVLSPSSPQANTIAAAVGIGSSAAITTDSTASQSLRLEWNDTGAGGGSDAITFDHVICEVIK